MHSILASFLPLMATLIFSVPDSVNTPSEATDSIPPQQLDEVVVKARRPQAVVTPEKISFNPSATLAGSSGTLYDALSSMPGVSVNGGSVSAFGQNGITVTVDGRKMMLQGSAFESYIKSVPVSNIERVELITAPSAHSDASSSTTVLNIKLRKVREGGLSVGTTGTFQGWRAKRGLGTAFIDFSNAKTSVMVSGSFVASRNPSILHTDRPCLEGEARILQVYHRYRTDRNRNASVSIDHSFSGRWSGGGSFSGNCFSRRELGLMDTRLSDSGQTNHTRNLTRMHNRNVLAGLYLKDTFDDHRGDLSIGLDHFSFNSDEIQDISDTSDAATDGKMDGCVRGYITTADYSRVLSGSWRIFSGVKSTLLNINNGGRYDGKAGVNDDLSSKFRGRENVNAGYLECSFAPTLHISLTAGVRVEQTNVRNRFLGNETGEKADFSRHTAGVFPNVSLSSQLTDRDGVLVSYARRVKRPRYSDLNPFVYILDDITHFGGNINLREAISENFQVAYIRDSWLRCAFSGAYIRNDIARYFREVADKTVYSSPENLPSHLNAVLSVSAMNVPLTRWWDVSGTISLVYDDYRFSRGLRMNNNRRITPMGDFRCRLDPFPEWSAEVSMKWRGRIAYAQTEIAPSGSLYVGIRYSLPGGKANITLFCKDLLNTNYRRNVIKLDGRRSKLEEKEFEDMRQIGVTLSYRLKTGTNKHKKRENMAADEINRVNL